MYPKNGSCLQIWVHLPRFYYSLSTLLHFYHIIDIILQLLPLSFLCAVECFLAKKEIETFAEVAVHFPPQLANGHGLIKYQNGIIALAHLTHRYQRNENLTHR